MLRPDEILEALKKYRLLDDAQIAALTSELKGKTVEPRALAGQLIQRQLLTPFQINQLFQGKGRELLLGSYVLMERLGEGGMGAVYKARNWKLNKIVAVKVIRKEKLANPDAVKRFQREIRAAATLDHPHIVRALDADEVGGNHLLAMELVEGGQDLAGLVKKLGPLPVDQACHYLRQAALGLQHAFERGLVHRDIKPQNLLVTFSRDMERGADQVSRPKKVIKILDFGLARVEREAGEESSTALTKEGAVMGTLDYLAPEQAHDSRLVDIRADLYSLGCTFYFALTGRVPFPGGEAMAKLIRHRIEEAAPIASLRSDVPPGLCGVIGKLMAKLPEDRFQTPAELAVTVEQVLAGKAVVFDPVPSRPAAAPAPVADNPFADNPFADNPFTAFDTGTSLTTALPPPAPGSADAAAEPEAASLDKRVLAGVGGVAALVLVVVLLALAGVFSPKEPPPKIDPKLIVEKKPEKKPRVFDPKEEEELRRLTEEIKRRDDEVQRRIQRDAAAAKAFVPLVDRFQAKDIAFGTFAQDVAAFQAKHGGSAKSAPAAALLMRLSAPVDRLEADKIPEATRREVSVWRRLHEFGSSPVLPKEVVTVLGEPAGRAGTKFTSFGFVGADRKTILGVAGKSVHLFEQDGLRTRARLDNVDVHAVSPDGRRLALGNHDGWLQVWDVDSATMLWVAPAFFQGGVRSLAWSPDGKTLATGGGLNRAGAFFAESNVVKLWDAADGSLLAQSAKLDNQVSVLAYSPDGQMLAAAALDGGVRLLCAAEATTIATLDKQGQNPVGLLFCPDNKYLASMAIAGGKGRLIVTDLDTHKMAVNMEGLSASQPLWAFSRDGQRLAVADGADIRLWDVVNFEEPIDLKGNKAAVTSLLFMPNNKTLVSASGAPEGAIRFWDMASLGAIHETSSGAKDAARSASRLSLSADGKVLAWAGGHGQVCLWDLDAAKLLTTLPVSKTASAYALSSAGRGVVAANDNNDIGLWNIGAAAPAARPFYTALAWHPEGGLLATGQKDGQVAIWSLDQSGPTSQPFPGQHPAAITSLAYSPDGATLATGGADASVLVWDAQTGARQHKLSGRSDAIYHIAFAPEGLRLAFTSAHENQIVIHDTISGGTLSKLGPHSVWLQSAAFSPCGGFIAAGTADGKDGIFLWDPSKEKKFLTIINDGQAGGIPCLAWSPDGKQLASATRGGRVRVWETVLGIEEFAYPFTEGTACSYRPDGKILATAHADGQVALWDPQNKTKVGSWRLPGRILHLSFSPEGRHLAALNADGTINILRLSEYLHAGLNPGQARQRQEDGAAARKTPVALENSLGMKFRFIPAGRFLMGSQDDEPGRSVNEGPQQEVAITRPFYLGTHPVTVGDFKAFVKDSGYQTLEESKGAKETWKALKFEQTDAEPVVCIAWKDAVAFCAWLSKKEKKTYRLASEAEWEYACRAGTQTAYYFGSDPKLLDDHAWWGERAKARTHPVGQLPANPWGLHDMLGNAWCLCLDFTGPFQNQAAVDPVGAPAGIRGASHFPGDPVSDFRSARRWHWGPEANQYNIGFRIVLDLRPPDLTAEEAQAKQAEAAGKLGVPVSLENSIGMKLRFLPPGTFFMGSRGDEPGRRPNEGPVHEVTLTKPIFMGAMEVTQDQYQKVMTANPSALKGGNLPVEQMTWYEAAEFCAKLSRLAEEKKAGRRYRLPTEAEWEYGCRAGTSSAYSFGADPKNLGDYAWFGGNDKGTIHAVGGLKPNAWGLFDMHGNVFELCADVHGEKYYETSPAQDPQGPQGGPSRVLRGGGLNHVDTQLRSANRWPDWAAVARANNIGFRVVCEIVGKAKAPP